jgi:hypothetical protein
MFYVFSSIKSENRGAEQVLRVEVEIGTGGSRGGSRVRGRRMNMVQIMYTHVYECKNDTVKTVPGMGV